MARKEDIAENVGLVSQHLDREVNAALAKGGFYSMLLGFIAGAIVGLLDLLGLAQNLTVPCVFAFGAGGYSLFIYILAKKGRMKGWVMYATIIPFINLPTFFFLGTHFILPAGAATFITGPISYLYFHLIIMTGFIFDFKLSLVAGITSGIGYQIVYLLAQGQLQQVQAADPILRQDLISLPIYSIKSFMMAFAGIVVGGISVIAKRLIFRILKEEQEKRYIDKLFGQYVSDEVKERIIREKAALVGERKKVVVLFSDIRRFSAYSEKHEPEQIVAQLNEYFDRMVESITGSGGVVDKFIGDAVMGTFGGVVDLANPCDSALAAARKMRSSLKELNERWKERGLALFDSGIGMHYGEVVQGSIGSKNRKEFTVIGDAVNTASRVEGLAKNYPCKIILTQSLYDILGEGCRSACVHLDRVKVKGKEEELEIYGVPD